MHWLNSFMDKLYAFWAKVRPGFQAVGRVLRKIGNVFYKIGYYLYLFRSVILAAPVAAVAVMIASTNLERLPEKVEITKMAIDTKAQDAMFGFLVLSADTISREAAVFGPLMLTAVCLVMMIFSKRAMYPFLIALFTLCLPFALYYFNIYPM